MADTAHSKPIPELNIEEARESDHALLARYVAMTPVARSTTGPFITFRAADAEMLINDEVSRQLETEVLYMRGIADGPIMTFFANAMLMANGDTHVRRRAPVARTFAFKLMDGMRGQIRELAEELVRANKNKGPIDFFSLIAQEIPARMIARILGVPQADLPVFSGWVNDASRALGPFPLELRPQVEKSLDEFAAYVTKLLDERRKAAREDFLSDYVRVTAEDGLLNEDEIRTQIMGLILAGSETTRTSICATLSLMLQHPEQWRAFCADPDGLKKGACAEGLRYEPAVAGILRVLKRDLDIDGYVMPEGAIVLVSFLTGMRDPAVYANPDAFDITRTDHPRWPLGFGAGAHRCLGEALARAELEETLAVIAREAPNTTLIKAPAIVGLGGIRRIDGMEVTLA